MASFTVQVREPARGGERCPTLLLLHGLGADENDLIGLSAELPDVRMVTLCAPFPYYMGYQWYGMEAVGDPDRAMLDRAQRYLSDFLEQELVRRYPAVVADGLFLGGFSQGALMASLYTLLQRGRELWGTVALSGYLPETVRASASLDGYPVFWGHGSEDGVLHWDWGREAATYLSACGADVEFHSYPMGHAVCLEEINDLHQWLNQQIALQAGKSPDNG